MAFVLLPHMLQFGAGDEHQVVVADDLAGVAHHAAATGGILHEIQFADVVAVDGIVELCLVAIGHIHEVALGQRRYLVQDSCFHAGQVVEQIILCKGTNKKWNCCTV